MNALKIDGLIRELDPELDPDIDYVYRAAKYVAKMFDLFDRKTGVKVKTPSAFDSRVEGLTAIAAAAPPASDIGETQ